LFLQQYKGEIEMEFFRLLVSLSILFSLSTDFARPINIEKLTLKAANIKNLTKNKASVVVTLLKKCPCCPRLRETYDKTFTISEQKNLIIKDEPNIIFDIKIKGSPSFLILDSKKKGELAVFSIKSEPEQTFPRNVDFDETYKNDTDFQMCRDGHHDYKYSIPEGITFQNFLDKIKKLYNKNNISKKLNTIDNDKPKIKISRIIHQFWFGKIKIPEMFQQWQSEWHAKHPKWLIMNWNENQIKKQFPNGLINEKIYDEARMMYDYATMSKVARYEILNKYGGLYIDPNIKCFENFESLHKIYDFYCGLGHFDTYGAINNGIFGACKGHPILKSCIDHIKKCETPPGGFFDWTAKNLGRHIFTKCVYENIEKNGNTDIVFPSTFFDGNSIVMEFNHCGIPYQAHYENVEHMPEAFCARGPYSYVK
jgi:hypothetical protein